MLGIYAMLVRAMTRRGRQFAVKGFRSLFSIKYVLSRRLETSTENMWATHTRDDEG